MPTDTYKVYFVDTLRKREKDNGVRIFKNSLRN